MSAKLPRTFDLHALFDFRQIFNLLKEFAKPNTCMINLDFGPDTPKSSWNPANPSKFDDSVQFLSPFDRVNIVGINGEGFQNLDREVLLSLVVLEPSEASLWLWEIDLELESPPKTYTL